MLKVIVVKTKNVWSYHLATLQIENIIAGREKQKDVPMIAKNNYNVMEHNPPSLRGRVDALVGLNCGHI